MYKITSVTPVDTDWWSTGTWFPRTVQAGWECPRCRCVFSPYVNECSHCNDEYSFADCQIKLREAEEDELSTLDDLKAEL